MDCITTSTGGGCWASVPGRRVQRDHRVRVILNVVQRQQRHNGEDTCMAEERGEVQVWRIKQKGHCVIQEAESWKQVEDGSNGA